MKKRILTFFVAVLCTICCGCSNDSEMVLYNDEKDAIYTESESLTLPTVAEIQNNEEIAEDENSRLFCVVYVCGAVNNPGVYELPEGSRIFDALSMAGGFSEEASFETINLAKLISDEEMIYVPTEEEILEGFDVGSMANSDIKSSGDSLESKKININTATKEELMTLPGVGESKANAIISFRQENGRFNSIEDLMKITGIKEGLFNKVKDSICVK